MKLFTYEVYHNIQHIQLKLYGLYAGATPLTPWDIKKNPQ